MTGPEDDTGPIQGDGKERGPVSDPVPETARLRDTTLGGRYHIHREVGRGGMAVVYLATDTRHGRDVAVKVIRRDVAATMGRERFLREIAIAARLRHPNIMPLYDSGDADGELYFVMPFEDGQSLRARLEDGEALSIGDAIGTLRDVARALAYAHAHGVVHRDIKPDNVMISGGAAVVTDFGIAKAVSAARGDTAANTVTRTGISVGTPTYMAPEQAVGDASTDYRADIYSFGCLAYELFSGTPPFVSESAHKLFLAHMSETPRRVTVTRPDVPTAIDHLIARCLEKDPARRPGSAQELVEALSMRESRIGRHALPRARGVRYLWTALATTMLVVAAVIGIRAMRAADGLASDGIPVAVLPMASVGGDSLQPLVAGGLSDDIQAALVRFPWVHVISRDGAQAYRDSVNIQSIGRQLGASYLVRGSFRTIAGVTTVRAELIRASDRRVVWAGEFDHPQELAVVRDAIAEAVSDSLRPHSSPGTGASVARPAHRGSDDAYRLYLMGKRKLDQRGQSIGESIQLFRQAVALDTLSAPAYSGLGLALALSPYFSSVSTTAVASEATRAAQRALALDGNLAEAHVALGIIASEAWDWGRAGDEYRAAIAIDPHDVESRVQYGRYLIYLNRDAEALKEFELARLGDPASAVASLWTAYAYLLTGQVDSAEKELDRGLEINPANRTITAVGPRIRLAAGRMAEARALVLLDPPMREEAMYTLAVTGLRDTVLARLRRLDAMHPAPWLAETARTYAWLGLGDTTRALAALERATAAHELWPIFVPINDAMFDGVRASPHFQALLRQVRLPSDFTAASVHFPHR